MAGLYSAYIAVRSILDPTIAAKAAVDYSWLDRLKGLLDLTPIFLLIFIVLGGIYAALPFFLLMGWRRGSSPCFRKSPCGCRKYCLIP